MSEVQKVVMVWSIKVLEPKLMPLGPVVIKCYVNRPDLEKFEERAVPVGENLFMSISKEVSKVRREIGKKVKGNSLIIIEVTGKGFAYRHGGKVEDSGEETLIFPAPSKLVKVGVYAEGKLKWFRPNKGEELYVYEGIIDAPSGVDFVIIDTENGSHILSIEKASPVPGNERPGSN